MKKNILLLAFCCITMVYSQQSTEIKDRWDVYTNPNTENYFYHHFKKYLSDDLISKNLFPAETSKIILEFNLDSIYNAINIRTNATNENLKNAIFKAFEEIDFQKIEIKSASTMHNYSLQLMALENGEPTLKCSSSFLHEIPPILEGCEKNKNYSDYAKCFISNLEYYLETSFDSTKIEDINFEKELKIYSKINFNKTGNLDILNVKSKDSILVEGIKEAIEKFNFRFRPANLNGIKDNYTVPLITSSNDIRISPRSTFFENASTENELSKHFQNELSSEIINLANFNLKRNNVTISFNIDEQNQLTYIQTNTSNEILEEAIINAFKKFPVENLHILEKNPLNNYIIQVLTRENNKNIIKCTLPSVFETYPILNGCEKSKNIVTLKKCNQNAINRQISSNFNLQTAKKLNRFGKVKIYAMFKINKFGEISDIRVRAPHKDLENETIRVLKKIRISKPGTQYGVPVGVKYSLPIAFNIEERKEIQIQNQKTSNLFRN